MHQVWSAQVVLLDVEHLFSLIVQEGSLCLDTTALGLRESRDSAVVGRALFLDFSGFFAHPRLNAEGFLRDFEDSGALGHWERGTIATIACFTAVSHGDAVVQSKVIVVVVVAAGDPLDSGLLNHRGKEASVACLTADGLFSMTKEIVVIVQIDVLIERNVHEKHTFAL